VLIKPNDLVTELGSSHHSVLRVDILRCVPV